MWSFVSTWPFSKQAAEAAAEILQKGGDAMDAVEAGIHKVESDPEVESVGKGGFLNAKGELAMDAAVMDGNTMKTGAVCGRVQLDGIFSLIKKTVQTGAGFMLAVFAGILKVQGMLGASFDSAAVKTARFAVDRIVPVVGGGISDTMDAAISSIRLINSAAGVTGMLAIAAACAFPLFKMAAALIAIRIARAVAQPVADGRIMEAAERFGDVIRLFLVLSITAVTISLVLIGAAVGAARSIS